MRSLITPDFFRFTKIVKKMGIREELKKIAKDVANVEAPKGKMSDEERKVALLKAREIAKNEMQIELMMIFIENISDAEEEIYTFIGGITETSVEDLKADPFKCIQLIKDVLSDPKIKDFFTTALK